MPDAARKAATALRAALRSLDLASSRERRAKRRLKVPLHHPERVGRAMSRAQRERFEELQAELWPRNEYTVIIAAIRGCQ